MRVLRLRNIVASHWKLTMTNWEDLKPDLLTNIQKFPKELNTDHLKTWKNSISICLMNWPKIKKKSFWNFVFSYSTQQWTISPSYSDLWQKVDFIWKPAMTISVTGPSSSSKALPKAKLAPKKKRTWSLFGGLLPIWSTTAFWILVKALPPRSTLNKSMKTGTKNCHNCSWHWSTEWAQFFPMTTPNHTSHNQCF